MYLENSFYQELQAHSWKDLTERLSAMTVMNVEEALHKTEGRNWEDFLALISTPALSYLEPMAKLSHASTVDRFGKVMNFFIPMYVSNECTNICTYCGYSMNNNVERITLNKEQVLKEVEVIKKMGFSHVVVLTGEAVQKVNMDYFKRVYEWIAPHFSHISFEVQPLTQDEYAEMAQMGLDGVYVYQETYNEERYKIYHPKGKKSNFRYRLETPERVGNAGIRKIGLGALLGLENARVENAFLALHYLYLKKRYWTTKFSVSFPRIKKADKVDGDFFGVSDRDLVQFICAWRLLEPDMDIVMSTRENSLFRDNVMQLGITSMSAASKTSPGAYANFKPEDDVLKQFETSDERDTETIKKALQSKGYEAVFKDWDRVL